ncbi:DUF4085 family protein [Paenibacillus sp. oral taxon 786]|uniref:DUF4085 family protein n=1 Tax=Paenibacillus sp. oral taxon 786 TaxID=652715 RepID=UPI0012FB5C55|nr:DUF4085 family protein [Paenibacillus sp. oral taxon 786]
MKYFTKAMYEQMQIRGYLVYPESEQELEADKAWYVEQGRDYDKEAKEMYKWFIQPLMLKHFPSSIHPQVLDGSFMKTRWPSPELAAWIREWKGNWDAEWKRRCDEYRDRYEQIMQNLPADARQLWENVRFHDARIQVFTPRDDGSVEIVLDEVGKEQFTRLIFQNVKSLRVEKPELLQGSMCLYEEIDWTEPHWFEFRLLLEAPREMHELSLVAGGVNIE